MKFQYTGIAVLLSVLIIAGCGDDPEPNALSKVTVNPARVRGELADLGEIIVDHQTVRLFRYGNLVPGNEIEFELETSNLDGDVHISVGNDSDAENRVKANPSGEGRHSAYLLVPQPLPDTAWLWIELVKDNGQTTKTRVDLFNERTRKLIETARQVIREFAKEEYALMTGHFSFSLSESLPSLSLKKSHDALDELSGQYSEQTIARWSLVDTFDQIVVRCLYERSVVDVTLTFNSDDQVDGLKIGRAEFKYSAPDYVDQKKFVETGTTVGDGEYVLPGALSIPNGKDPFPAVVLVHDAGRRDRDHTMGMRMPFRDIAWGLASRGIAVLRYDQRSMAHPDKLSKQIEWITSKDEIINDAVHAVEKMRASDIIDRKRVFVLGYGMGGTFAPRIALEQKHLAGLIILGSGTLPVEDAILRHDLHLASFDGKLDEREKQQLAMLTRAVKLVKSSDLTEKTPRSVLPLQLPAPYWLDLRKYRPLETVQLINKPVLVVHGGRDYVAIEQDYRNWEDALSGRPASRLRLFPDMNHALEMGEGRSGPTDLIREGHVDVQVIETIAEWVNSMK